MLLAAGLIIVLACRAGSVTGQESGAGGERPSEVAHSLDLSHASISSTIGAEVPEPWNQKFVEFEVLDVVNPRLLPAIFEVHYQRGDRERLLLGTFSLFPPNNPGTFIVATRGLLEPEGTIVLSLLRPQGAAENDTLRVDFAPIRFRRE